MRQRTARRWQLRPQNLDLLEVDPSGSLCFPVSAVSITVTAGIVEAPMLWDMLALHSDIWSVSNFEHLEAISPADGSPMKSEKVPVLDMLRLVRAEVLVVLAADPRHSLF